MRGAAVTLVVGLSVAGAALGAGWGLQAAVLPPAARSDRVAADAAAWLLRYRVTAGAFRIGRRRERGTCLRAWFPRRNGRLARGSILLLANGGRIAANGGPTEVAGVRRPLPSSVPELALELAGCPGVLGSRLAGAAVDGGIRANRAFADGRPALALHLPTLLHRLGRRRLRDRVTVYVGARAHVPLAVAASLGRWSGVGRIRLTKATPRVLARFGPLTTPGTGWRA